MRTAPLASSRTRSAVRSSRKATSRPSGEKSGWKVSAGLSRTAFSTIAVALKKLGSAASVRSAR
ncbi:MAG: hypothetical protein R6X21_12240 [Candidatus Aminicenantes bacterium]